MPLRHDETTVSLRPVGCASPRPLAGHVKVPDVMNEERGPEIVVRLTPDEALVLHAWLADNNERRALLIADQSEQRVLWDLEAALEPQLPVLLSSTYQQDLEIARAALRDPEA